MVVVDVGLANVQYCRLVVTCLSSKRSLFLDSRGASVVSDVCAVLNVCRIFVHVSSYGRSGSEGRKNSGRYVILP